jgi:hypothetical protein
MSAIDFSKHIRNLTPEMQWWLNQTVELLAQHSEMSEPEATEALLRSSSMIAVKEDPNWLLRESPFYWAMEILDGREVLLGHKGPAAPSWCCGPNCLDTGRPDCVDGNATKQFSRGALNRCQINQLATPKGRRRTLPVRFSPM